MSELLTTLEQSVLSDLATAWNKMVKMTGGGASRQNDLLEASMHIHALQNIVWARAAARAYPELYRLSGETL